MADNWWSQAFAKPQFRTALSEMGQDLGYGLANASNIGNAFGMATRRGAEMEPYRDQRALQAEEKAKLTEQTNVTRSWLEQQGYADLVPLVDAGQADIAYGEALKRMQPGYGATEPVRPIEVNGQLVNPMTGEVVGDYRDPQSGFGNAPSGYQWNPDGTQSYVPGGPADPASATPKPPTDAQIRAEKLATVVQPELQVLLGDGTAPGVFDALANGGNQAWNVELPGGARPGFGMTSPEFQQATSALETIAQSYLYAISGQAAPAEEVRKIVTSLTPRPFEDPASVAEKKRRLQTYVEAMQLGVPVDQVGGAPGTGNSGDGWEVIGVQ